MSTFHERPHITELSLEQLIAVAAREAAWLREIEHCEGSYATSYPADILDRLAVVLKFVLDKAVD